MKHFMASRNDSGTSDNVGLISSFLCLLGTNDVKSLIGTTIGNSSSFVSSGINEVPNTLSGPIYVEGDGRLMIKSLGNRLESSWGIKMLAKGVAVYPTEAVRLNLFKIEQIYLLIVVGSSFDAFVLIDALSASSSIIRRDLLLIFPFSECVFSQVLRRFNTVEFFFTTRSAGCGALKLKPAVLAERLVKSPF